jgi:energy-coupling factor transporter ATP-binding protein EcfA2
MAKSTDISVRQLGPKSAKKSIRFAIKKRRPVFLWGPPGIGKSDIVKQIGEELNREVIDVRLALWEPTDIKGIPYYNADQGKMVWAPPAELPVDPESTAIIFLDELNSAPPAVQAAAYQLILNRRVGTYELPKGVDVVAAGNREGDRGVTYRMPAPLANRFIHLEAKVDFDDFQEWAVMNNVHPEVVGYVGFAKQDLYDFDPKSPSKAFATPRSWVFVSDLLNDEDCDVDTLHNLIAGAVGDGLAVKFMAHRKIAGKLPKASDILEGKVKDLQIKEVSAMYSLTVSLCYELKDAAEKKDKKFDEKADNFFRYMMDNFPTELVVMGAKTGLTNYNLPFDATKMKSFDEFHKRFGKYVLSAMEN